MGNCFQSESKGTFVVRGNVSLQSGRSSCSLGGRSLRSGRSVLSRGSVWMMNESWRRENQSAGIVQESLSYLPFLNDQNLLKLTWYGPRLPMSGGSTRRRSRETWWWS